MTRAPLYGDYELLIDQCLGGDRALKQLVAQKDRQKRGGLAVLQNALKNRGAQLDDYHERVLRQCIQDQEHWEAKQDDLTNIRSRPNGKFQVRAVLEHNRISRTFDSLEEAQLWRSRVAILDENLRLSGE